MANKKPEPTQKTRPKEGEPIDIPVPRREVFEKLLKRAARKGLATGRSRK
jgi:hypothetical protein